MPETPQVTQAMTTGEALVYLARRDYDINQEGDFVDLLGDGLVWYGSLNQMREFAGRLKASGQ